jgi:hypothetical protein
MTILLDLVGVIVSLTTINAATALSIIALQGIRGEFSVEYFFYIRQSCFLSNRRKHKWNSNFHTCVGVQQCFERSCSIILLLSSFAGILVVFKCAAIYFLYKIRRYRKNGSEDDPVCPSNPNSHYQEPSVTKQSFNKQMRSNDPDDF